MLCLERHRGESVIITAPDGTRIEVMVRRVERNRAHLGIKAPRSWTIDRIEVDAAKRAERGEISGNV